MQTFLIVGSVSPADAVPAPEPASASAPTSTPTSEPASAPARQRRRGPELESALLAAAWDELVETGFAKLTMESVAARAGTGIAVLYRRWPNKEQLVLAALEFERGRHPVELPDTGTLRDDLLGTLTGMGEARVVAVAVAAAFSGLLADTGLTRPRCATRSSANSGSPASTPSTSAPTNAARSTWSGSPPRCSPCPSTWCGTT